MPKLEENWTEEDHYAALDVAKKLAETDPLLLPSSKDGLSYLIFRRMTSPKDLPDSGPIGEKYFAALEKLYLKYGRTDPKRFEADFPKIQSGRLRYVYPRLSYTKSNAPIADNVHAALMSWSRARFDLKNENSETFDRGMKESEFLVVNILKRMSPEFQAKILVKLDAVAAQYPEAARNQKITPDLLEKLMVELDNRPPAMRYKMQAVAAPDSSEAWGAGRTAGGGDEFAAASRDRQIKSAATGLQTGPQDAVAGDNQSRHQR